MKKFTVMVWFINNRTDFFQTTNLAEARRKFAEWSAHWQSVHVVIE